MRKVTRPILCAGVAIAIAAIVLWSYGTDRRASWRRVEQKLRTECRAIVHEVAQWRQERLGDAALLAVNAPLHAEARLLLTQAQAAPSPDMLTYLHTMRQRYRYAAVELVSSAGELVLSQRAAGVPGAAEVTVPQLPWEQMDREPVELMLPGPNPEMLVVVPVLALSGSSPPLGGFLLRLDAHAHLSHLLPVEQVSGWPLRAGVFTQREQAVVPVVQPPGAQARLQMPLVEFTKLRQRQPQEELHAYMDPTGQPLLAFMRPVPGSDWWAITGVTRDAVRQSWEQHTLLALTLAFGYVLVVLACLLRTFERERHREQQAQVAARRTLLASVGRLAGTLDAIGDAALITDAHGRVELLNAQAQALTGWSDAQARGQAPEHLFTLTLRDDPAVTLEPWHEIQRTRQPLRLTDVLLDSRCDQRQRIIRGSLVPILQEHDELVGSVMVFQDASTELLREAAALARVRMVEVTSRGGVAQALPQLLRIVGTVLQSPLGYLYEPEQSDSGQTPLWLELTKTHPPESPDTPDSPDSPASPTTPIAGPDHARVWRRGWEQETALAEELSPAAAADPRLAPALQRWLAAPVRRGGVVQAVLCLANKPAPYTAAEVEVVSQLAEALWVTLNAKRAEQATALMMRVIEQATDSVVITNAQNLIEYVNPAFEKLTGYTRQEVHRRNPRLLQSGRHDEEFYQSMWRALHQTGVWHGRMVNRRKDGSLFTEDATLSVVRDEQGQVVNFLAIKRDVTELVELTNQYQQVQKMDTLGRLAGGVAHDYNNMMTVIVGYAELALEQLKPTDDLHAYLVEINRAARRSSEITRQLLAFARKQDISPRVVDLNESIEALLKMVRKLIGENLELQWCRAADLWPVHIDPTQLDQVVVNLCVNARDAIAGVGRISITVNNVDVSEAFCAKHPHAQPGQYVRLAVADNGCGMDAQTLQHIFEPFFTTKGVGQGTGLGLAMVYGIVTQNGGFIDCQSTLGQGTTMNVYLPRSLRQQDLQPSAATQPPAGGGELILVVDDEVSVLRTTGRILRGRGFHVMAAASPSEALRMARLHEGNIDLLITDVIMPEMNGRQLAEHIRAFFPQIKVLYISGYTADVISTNGVLDADINYLQKPFTRDTLLAKIHAVLTETPGPTATASDPAPAPPTAPKPESA